MRDIAGRNSNDISRLQRRIARPSFRLYDLLALVAIRKNQNRYLQELRDVIAAQPQEFQMLFASRLAHWQTPSKRATRSGDAGPIPAQPSPLFAGVAFRRGPQNCHSLFTLVQHVASQRYESKGERSRSSMSHVRDVDI